MLRKIAVLAVVGLSIISCVGVDAEPKEYEASSPEIRYVGRVHSSDDGVSFDWSGTYLECRFRGEKISVRVSDTKRNYYNVFIDGEQRSVISTSGCDTLITLADSLGDRAHTLRLQKRTEGEQGRTTIHSLVLEQGGELLALESLPSRHIEFVGDSLTAGYGTEGLSKDEPYLAETQNCNLAHSAIIARYFDADYTLIAHSGRGVARNYGDKNTTSEVTMAEHIERMFDEDPASCWDWKASPHTPDIVVIHLGTNDFSTMPYPSKEEFTMDYIKILRSLRAGYGEQVPILCVAPYVGSPCFDYIKEMVKNQPVANLYFTAVVNGNYCNDSSELGSSAHPNYIGQRKMAMTLIPYISTITGWEIQSKVIE